MESYPWRADLKSKGYGSPNFEDFYNPVTPDPSRAARVDAPPFYSAKGSDTAFLTNELLSESVDIMLTILELVAQPMPSGGDGASLVAILAGQTPEKWRNYVHLELDFGQPDQPSKRQLATGTDWRDSNLAILRESRFKLVHFNGGLPPVLFDLQTDPHEMHNLAADPAHTETLLRLTQKLLSHKMRHADQSLTGVKIRRDGAWNFKN